MNLQDYIKLDFKYYLAKHIKAENLNPMRGYSISEIKELISGRNKAKIEHERQYDKVKTGKIGFQDLYNEIENYLLNCLDGNSVHFDKDVKTKSFTILRFEEYGEIWATFDFYKFLVSESKNQSTPSHNTSAKIFVSHSSKDEGLVRDFVDRILLLGLNMQNEDIFCTSIEGMGIKSGDDFRNKIKQQLKESEIIIQLITENYKQSEVCLNEMGAAWVLNAKVVPFIVEPIRYDNIGFIHNTTQLLKLNKKKDLLKFKDDHKDFFNSTSFNLSRYDQQIDEFLKVFQSKVLQFKPMFKKQFIPTQKEIESYFSRFLEPDIDVVGLMLKAQPNIADCKAIFTEEYFREVYSFNSMIYRSMLEGEGNLDQISTKDVFDIRSTKKDELEKEVTSERKRIFVESLRPNVIFFTVSFKNYGTEYGTSFSFWVFINGRWVFFPKPWRTIYSVADLKTDETLQKIVKTINRFGIGKELNKEGVEMEFFIAHLIQELKKQAK